MGQTGIDFDRIRDRELNEHLDEKYREVAQETQDAMLDEAIFAYLDILADEPLLDSALATMDNFGLDAREFSDYFRRWVEKKL